MNYEEFHEWFGQAICRNESQDRYDWGGLEAEVWEKIQVLLEKQSDDIGSAYYGQQ